MRFALLFSALLLFACARDNNNGAASPPPATGQTQSTPTPTPAPTATPSQAFVKTGHWGGQEISLDVYSQQSKYELSCAAGTIDEPMALDQFNHFSVRGTYQPHHGGPIHPGEPQPSYPARYDGTVVGNMMDLVISTKVNGNDQHQSYRLMYNQQPVIHHCL